MNICLLYITSENAYTKWRVICISFLSLKSSKQFAVIMWRTSMPMIWSPTYLQTLATHTLLKHVDYTGWTNYLVHNNTLYYMKCSARKFNTLLTLLKEEYIAYWNYNCLFLDQTNCDNALQPGFWNLNLRNPIILSCTFCADATITTNLHIQKRFSSESVSKAVQNQHTSFPELLYM